MSEEKICPILSTAVIINCTINNNGAKSPIANTFCRKDGCQWWDGKGCRPLGIGADSALRSFDSNKKGESNE